MKKNWVIFILICVATWVWMVSGQIKDSKAYDDKLKEYKVALAAWNEQQEETERVRAEARAEAAKALQQLQTTPELATADAASTTTVTPVISTVRGLQRTLYNPETAPRVEVDTPLYRVVISELGARPILWEIKTSEFVRNVSWKDGSSSNTVQMIPAVGNADLREYPLGFYGSTARDFNNLMYNVERFEDDVQIRLTMTSEPLADQDLIAVREYTFRKKSYVVDLKVSFRNGPTTRKAIGGRLGFGLGWQGGFGEIETADRVHGLINAIYAAEGDVRVRQVNAEKPLIELNSKVDWAGFEKKFFTALLVPQEVNPPQSLRISYDRKNDAPEYTALGLNPPMNVELIHAPVELNESETATLQYQLYVGPKNRESLAAKDFTPVAGITDPTAIVFHTMPLAMSFLRPLALVLLFLMRSLHEFAGAWGLAIIGTTLIVRIVIYPLTHWAIKAQAKTMIEQQKIRPEMEEIQKKFKGDPMKRNQAVMQLYRDHNVNPLGMLRGCVPILLQMPIFLSLYIVFEQSVELRGKPFLWITDLSGPDRLIDWGFSIPLVGTAFNLLPILMAATNYIQMRIMQMPATDEMQAQIQKQMMVMMPIVFTFFLYHLPSGLILYWIVSNIISIGQSVMTKRIMAKHMAAHEASKNGNGAFPSKGNTKELPPRPGTIRS